TLSSHARRPLRWFASALFRALHSAYQTAATKFICLGGISSIICCPATDARSTSAAPSSIPLRKSASAARGCSQKRSINWIRSSASKSPENAKHFFATDMSYSHSRSIGARHVEERFSGANQLGFHCLAHP